MRIVLGITVHNEIEYGPHIWTQLEHSIDMDYDDIVILDDGSTDGTWDVIQEYSKKDNRIHGVRNEKNSIISRGSNRWIQLWNNMSKYDPTWINIRACDQIYSKHLKNDFRQIVEKFHNNTDAGIVKFPLAHLWRSMYWYRTDNVWGREANQQLKLQLYRYHKDWSFDPRFHLAKFHLGGHVPVFPGHEKRLPLNSMAEEQKDKNFLYTVLHLGHSTHEKKAAKFRWTMEASSKGIAINSPGPKGLPPVNTWLRYSGIKGFYEFCITLERAPQKWFEEKIPEDLSEPEFKSFFNVINEYNKGRAAEYNRMFTEFKKRRFKDGKQTVVKKPPVKVVFEEPVERKPIVICEKCKKENRKVLMKYREAQNNIVFSCPSCKDIIRKPKEKPTKGSVNVGNKPKTKEIDPTKTNKPFIR